MTRKTTLQKTKKNTILRKTYRKNTKKRTRKLTRKGGKDPILKDTTQYGKYVEEISQKREKEAKQKREEEAARKRRLIDRLMTSF